MEQLILENMQFAERIGQKYAHRNGRHVDEAVAEAYFCLVSFFLVDFHLYTPGKYKRTLGTYIKRALIKYFERQVQRPDILKETIIKNTDEEMIEFLSGLFPDEKAFKIFNLIRGGINLYEIDIVDPELRKAASKLRLQVASRIRRISELKAAGIKVSREIIPGVINEETPSDQLAA